MEAIIMAGGKGTRLLPYTAEIPKPLLPVGDRPILAIILEQLRAHGFNDVTLCVGYMAELIESFVGDGSRLGLRVGYSRESMPLGTVGALALIDRPEDPFLVMNGDVLTDLDYGDMMQWHRNSEADMTMAVRNMPIVLPYGSPQVREDLLITSFLEKPTMGLDVNMGIYAVNPSLIDYITIGKRIGMDMLVRALIQNGKTVKAYRHSGMWLDIGSHEDYKLANSAQDA
jgi:NDP-sugar pyrophosphorylase family protein